MFEGLYEKITDIDAVLDRLEIKEEWKKSGEISPEWLDRLFKEYLYHVPFDALDPWGGKETPSLETTALMDKMIYRKRGGYCFEMNSLFKRILEALGFNSYNVIIHIQYNKDFFAIPAHCGIVTVIDGKKYFGDVGFGGPAPLGIVPYDGEFHGNYKVTPGEIYTTVYRKDGDKEFKHFMYKDIPADPIELFPMNFQQANDPKSVFVTDPKLQIVLEKGRIALAGGILRYNDGETKWEKQIEDLENEVPKIAEEYFGIPIDEVPAKK